MNLGPTSFVPSEPTGLRSPRDVVLAGVALTFGLGVLALDLTVSAGLGVASLYVVPVVLGLWSGWRHHGCWIALACEFATAAAWFAETGGAWDPEAVGRVALDMLAIASTAFAVQASVTWRQRQDAERAAAEALRERLAAQESLARLGEIASLLAHEVQNPVAGVGAALDVLAARMPEDAPDRKVVETMRARLRALGRSVEELLRFSQPRAPRRAIASARGLIEGAVGALRDDPGRAGPQVEFEAEDFPVHVDAELLRMALVHVLDNAAQAAGPGGHVRVRGERDGDRFRVVVEDDGPGIPEAQRAKVFEPFFTTRTRGTGLGLPVVRRVVEDHGGVVRLACGPTGGTTVTLEIPTALPSA